MPKPTREKLLYSFLKALLAAVEASPAVKFGSTLVAELNAQFGNLSKNEQNTLAGITEKELATALQQLDFATKYAAAASVGIIRVEELAESIRAEMGRQTVGRGYVTVSPYDGELVRRALQARPPEWLRERVPLPQWEELSDTPRSRLIFGKPGAGKTTTIFEQLELAKPEKVLVVQPNLSEGSQIERLLDEAAGGAVIVFDDVQANHKMFVSLCMGLQARTAEAAEGAERYNNVILLAAARGQEWEALRPEIPIQVLQDMGLLGEGELTLKNLDEGRCRRLIEICRDEWNLVIEERLLKQAAEVAAERDATPLYVISMLAAARGRADRTLLDEHLAGLPENVRDLWNIYWIALDATSQGVLRLVRLFWAAETPPQVHLLSAAAKSCQISPADLSARLDALERSLWLTRTAGVPACLDVQLEVINLDTSWYNLWNKFVFAVETGLETRRQLHNGTGSFYCKHVAPRAKGRVEYHARLADAARHFEAMGDLARGPEDRNDLALSFNNASICYGELAGLETTRAGRQSWLIKAIAAVEEAVRIDRELGVRDNLAMSLNNVSNHYSELAGLETTRAGRHKWLSKVTAAVEEAIGIRRELGVCGDLATSLNNVSNHYSELADLETTRAGRQAWLSKAVAAVEEAVRVFRELGVHGDLAGSLNNVSNHYNELAGLETTREGRQAWLIKAVAAVEEAVRIDRELDVRGDLAMLLSNASIRYSELAALETTRESRRVWLIKAVAAVEESIGIRRELGVRGGLAISLNNASNRYSALAGLETTRAGRHAWLSKAIAVVEEAVRIDRELGVRGDLAISLGSLCQHQCALAEGEPDPPEIVRRLKLAREAIDEAVELSNHTGNMPHLLLSLQDAVDVRLLEAQASGKLDADELMELIDEGLDLAKSLEEEQAIEYFTDLKHKLSEGGE